MKRRHIGPKSCGSPPPGKGMSSKIWGVASQPPAPDQLVLEDLERNWIFQLEKRVWL